MNLAEMLLYADIEHLNRIAKRYNCTCNFHSKNELIQSILTSFHRQSTYDLATEEMSDEIYRFLQLLIFDNRNDYSKEELLAKAKQSLHSESDMTDRMIFIEALQRGWIFPGIMQKNKFLFSVPTDVRTSLSKRIGEYNREQYIHKASIPEYYRDEGTLLIDDFVTFLQFLTKDIIQLTSDGQIYKRHQLLLFDKFTTKENPIEKGGWRFGFGYRYPQYPDRFSLLYDYAIHNRLISEGDGTALTLTDAGLNKLETYIPLFEGREFYRFWIRLYRRPIPHLQYIVNILHATIGSDWVTVDSAKSVVLPWLTEYYYESVDSLFENRIIQMLYYLGVIKKGKYRDKEVISFTNNGQQWIRGVSEELKEIDFSEYKKVRSNFSRI